MAFLASCQGVVGLGERSVEGVLFEGGDGGGGGHCCGCGGVERVCRQ